MRSGLVDSAFWLINHPEMSETIFKGKTLSVFSHRHTELKNCRALEITQPVEIYPCDAFRIPCEGTINDTIVGHGL